MRLVCNPGKPFALTRLGRIIRLIRPERTRTANRYIEHNSRAETSRI